jgi:hypothetical protein
LLISAPGTIDYLVSMNGATITAPQLGRIILQTVAVIFYAASAWTFKARGFAHVSAWLSIIPFTVAWNIYGFKFTPLAGHTRLWTTSAYDRLVLTISSRYTYPYLAGYALSIFVLIAYIHALDQYLRVKIQLFLQ